MNKVPIVNFSRRGVLSPVQAGWALALAMAALALVALPRAATAATGAQKQVVVAIKGMSCPVCAHHLQTLLEKLPGARKATVSLKTGRAVVSFGTNVTVSDAQIEQKIRDAGFVPGKIQLSGAQTKKQPAHHTYQLIESAKTDYPYSPRTLNIPAGQVVRVAVTDRAGGCMVRTIFEGLGPSGHAAEITVPKGKTRVVQLYATHPGRYAFHCGMKMFSGTVVAR